MDVVVQQACTSAGVNESADEILPTGMALAAKANFLMRDRRVLLVHLSKVENCCSSCSRLSSLSWGRLMVCSVVSITTPWDVMHVVGGVRFSSLIATTSSLQSASICVKVSRQVLVCGGPAMRKSSR